jgi:hypothetical protein
MSITFRLTSNTVNPVLPPHYLPFPAMPALAHPSRPGHTHEEIAHLSQVTEELHHEIIRREGVHFDEKEGLMHVIEELRDQINIQDFDHTLKTDGLKKEIGQMQDELNIRGYLYSQENRDLNNQIKMLQGHIEDQSAAYAKETTRLKLDIEMQKSLAAQRVVPREEVTSREHMLLKATNVVCNQMETMKAEHEEELTGQISAHKDRVDTIEVFHGSVIAAIRKQMEATKVEHYKENRRQFKNHGEEVESLNQVIITLQNQVTTQCNTRNDQVDALKAEHFKEMDTFREWHDERMDTIKSKHEKEFNTLKAQFWRDLDRVRAWGSEETETFKAEHKNEIDTIKAEHEEKEIETLKTEREKEIRTIKAEHEQEIDTINDEHSKDNDALDAEYDEEIGALNAEHEDDMKLLKAEHAENMALHLELLKARHDAAIMEQHRAHMNETKYLNRAIERLQNAVRAQGFADGESMEGRKAQQDEGNATARVEEDAVIEEAEIMLPPSPTFSAVSDLPEFAFYDLAQGRHVEGLEVYTASILVEMDKMEARMESVRPTFAKAKKMLQAIKTISEMTERLSSRLEVPENEGEDGWEDVEEGDQEEAADESGENGWDVVASPL